jgi:hypothetical protein
MAETKLRKELGSTNQNGNLESSNVFISKYKVFVGGIKDLTKEQLQQYFEQKTEVCADPLDAFQRYRAWAQLLYQVLDVYYVPTKWAKVTLRDAVVVQELLESVSVATTLV